MSSPARQPLVEEASGSISRDATYRIYATSNVGEGTSLLEQSRRPLTAPAWSPDGRSLAFGRVAGSGAEGYRLELVVQDGIRKQKVLVSRPLADADSSAGNFTASTLAWSPDGRYLAICGPPASLGLSVIRADNGRVLKTVEAASWPSWSPDSNKLAFLVSQGLTSSLYVLNESFGPMRKLTELGQTFQAPWWSRDGRTLLVATRRPSVQSRRAGAMYEAYFARVRVATGDIETAVRIGDDTDDRVRPFRSMSFAIDRDGEDMFFSADVETQAKQVIWYRPKNHETFKRDNPVDFTVKVGALSLSPVSHTLGLRVGPQDAASPLGLWDVENNQFTALAPDDASRIEWLILLINSARRLLPSTRPLGQGSIAPTPSILPVPGETLANSDPNKALPRIGRIGRPLCDRPASDGPAGLGLQTFLNEARFFFDALRGDARAALSGLEPLEQTATSADHLTRLLCLRGQLLLELGEVERAQDVASYLKSEASRPRSRFEATSEGPRLTKEIDESIVWAEQLTRAVAAVEKRRSKPGESEGSMADHPNPDAPPGIGHGFPIDRELDPGVFAPVTPRIRLGNGMPFPNDPPGVDPPVLPRFRRVEPPR
jgi:hypothetical protein